MKNIIIRDLNSKDNEIIEEVKKSTGEKTASKALLQAASDYLLYKKKYRSLERRYMKLVDKMNK